MKECQGNVGTTSEGPYAFIQWKGTDVCADLHCSCGAHMHLDIDFMYAVQCPHCGQRYEVGVYVPLIPIDEPCEYHEPILMTPDCNLCSSEPCEHQEAWKAAPTIPLGYPWPADA